MYEYRVTKYNPVLRDEKGAFQGDEWTSVSDIGGVFSGKTLTRELYSKTEDAYLNSIKALVGGKADEAFSVQGLESYGDSGYPAVLLTGVEEAIYPALYEGERVAGERLFAAIRANLRDLLWCRLEHSGQGYIHFGQDFYVYVGSAISLAMVSLPSGIYVEQCESPIGK